MTKDKKNVLTVILAVIISTCFSNVDPTHAADNNVWVVDIENGAVLNISTDGRKILSRVEGFEMLFGIAVNPADGTCWVSDLERGEITKVSSNGQILKRISGFDRCRGLSLVDLENGVFWLGNSGAGEIVKLNREGEILDRIPGFKWPRLVVVDKDKD